MGTGDPIPAVYFLSDYGTADEFVGVVHAVLHARIPAVPVIDLGHQVPPFDVEAGAAMLVRCAPYLRSGVVLAVVDPGVGTDRRGLAVETGGPGPRWLVGPDNGLLLPLAAALGGVRRAIALRPPMADGGRSDPTIGRTFDGRDLFAPAAARLVLGGPQSELGSEVDPASLVTGGPDQPVDGRPGRSVERLAGRNRGAAGDARSDVEIAVTWIDRFGNVQVGATRAAMDELGVDPGGRVRVTLPGPPAGRPGDHPARSESARWVGTFGDLEAGELGVLVDSTGRLAMVLCRASAADHLAPLTVGDTIGMAADRGTMPSS